MFSPPAIRCNIKGNYYKEHIAFFLGTIVSIPEDNFACNQTFPPAAWQGEEAKGSKKKS